MDIKEILDERMREVGKMAKEIAEREFEILELNLMISSQIAPEHSKKTDEYVKSLREQVKNKDVGLEEADQYLKCLQ